MPPASRPDGALRSVPELNAAIRALWSHRDARLSDAERAEYEQLLTEWSAATRREVVEAA
ncbi:hypothetical protein [Streptomyces sp. NPDC046821]|uniref:hypothetical protein n=1 Tax=Streptomyces sp. NPDC046821 TaxID=3154702 RepID=UPI0033DD12EC